MRKNVLKPPRENKDSCLWQSSKRNVLTSNIPVINTVDDEEYFFEVEDY